MSASFTQARDASVPAVPGAGWSFRRIGAALLPFVLIVLWCAVIRLPFYEQTDKDEFFFSVIAEQWLAGGVPYVATFDLKPPGLFFLYVVVQSIFGASLATIKAMEIAAVALGTYCLYLAMRRNVSERAALWAAIMLPIYMMAVAGSIAVNMILQMPFIVAAFSASMVAISDDSTPARRVGFAVLAGLAIGYAGMVKQTAIFEAIAFFIVLGLYGGRSRSSRLAVLAAYAAGAVLPAAAFALYFAGVGAFRQMLDAVVFLSLDRTATDVTTSYGPQLAYYFTPLGVLENTLVACGPLVFLLGAALFVVLRRQQIFAAVSSRIAVAAAIWLAAGLASVLFGRVLSSYYCLALVPPLVVLAAIFFAHGLQLDGRRATLAFVLSLVVGAVCLGALERKTLFTPNAFLAGDYDAERRVSDAILAMNPSPDDRLLVLNRGFSAYTRTGLFPPSPYFHATHLLGVFPTPSPDPLGEALAARPRFIVIADPSIWHITELPSRYRQALDWLAAHYRAVVEITGQKDSFTVYELIG